MRTSQKYSPPSQKVRITQSPLSHTIPTITFVQTTFLKFCNHRTQRTHEAYQKPTCLYLEIFQMFSFLQKFQVVQFKKGLRRAMTPKLMEVDLHVWCLDTMGTHLCFFSGIDVKAKDVACALLVQSKLMKIPFVTTSIPRFQQKEGEEMLVDSKLSCSLLENAKNI